MVWTTPRTWVAGEVVTAANLNTHLRDNMKAIGDPWTAYTPTWSSTGTVPTIGNGTQTGFYVQAGKLIHFRLKITAGSTTTYGTGAYLFGLPVPATSIGTDALDLTGYVFDASATARAFRSGYLSGGNVVLADQSGVVVSATVPFALANGDSLSVAGTYEAA